jgi:hypothetical protein
VQKDWFAIHITGQDHSSAFFAPECHGSDIGKDRDLLADQILRREEGSHSGHDLSFFDPQVNFHLNQLVSTFQFGGRQDSANPDIELLEILKANHRFPLSTY